MSNTHTHAERHMDDEHKVSMAHTSEMSRLHVAVTRVQKKEQAKTKHKQKK